MPEPRAAADRIVALADQCVRCGLCQPVCPTYEQDRNEAESPRGRIALMQALAQDRLPDATDALRHVDHCLACRACERACPAHVRFGELLDLSRAAMRPQRRVAVRKRALEWLLLRRARLDAALVLARLVRPLSRTLRSASAPLPRRVPWPVAHAEASNAASADRGPAWVFAGCLGRHADADAVHAAVRVLRRIGFDASVPVAQQCCGALHRHAGAVDGADTLAHANRAAFPGDAPIFTLASGCHDTIAATFAPKRVLPLLGFLAQDTRFAALPLRARNPGRVALHLPCTQRNVVGDASAVAALLARIPGIETTSMPAGCCGAAGTHMLDEPERAAALRAPLLDAAARSGAATLCSANVGCRMFLAAGLHARGQRIDTRHPIELLDASLD